MKKNRVLGILISFALMLTMMPVLSQTVYADGPINYIDENGVVRSCTEYTPISTGTDHDWSGGWYFATGAIINERITVNGVVNVILCDDTDLYANKGITVGAGSTLNIYAQSTGSNAGQLVSEVPEGNELEGYAGIGGVLSGAIGKVTINGGKITAKGGKLAAGIGGGSSEANVGTVTINGGSVEATGRNGGAGIGGSEASSGVIVTINGGSVKAFGDNGGAGIGGGEAGSGGTVTINGGSVEAFGDNGGAGIGGGDAGLSEKGGAGGNVTINGGSVTATGKGGAAGIGGGGPYGSSKGGAGGTVTINGGIVTATCGESGRAAIGSGKGGSPAGTVTIGKGVTVKAGDSESDSSYIKASTFEEAHNHFMWARTHTHSFTYSAGTGDNSNTITATCSAAGCYLPENTATLTIEAPEHSAYGDNKEPDAVITDTYGIRDGAKVQYQTRNGDSYGTASESAPTDAGDYRASITLGNGDNSATASVEYSIAKADPAPAPVVKTVTVNVSTVNAKALNAAVAKAGGTADSIKTITLGKKVKKISKNTFKKYRNAKTLVVKTKKLKKAGVKNSLKGSKVTKIKVQVGNKKTNKTYVKKYKSIFTKKNAGKKVKVSL